MNSPPPVKEPKHHEERNNLVKQKNGQAHKTITAERKKKPTRLQLWKGGMHAIH